MSLGKDMRSAVGLMSRFLEHYGIPFGLGGSIALLLWGYAEREPKDIDFYVGASAERVMAVFANEPKMIAVGNSSPGHVKYLFTNGQDRQGGVSIDCICSKSRLHCSSRILTHLPPQ